jgi:hypothetical protein
MEDLRNRILVAIQEIKTDKNKMIFTLHDISKLIVDVKKKLLSNEINKLISDEMIEIVVYEPIYMALKEDVKYLKTMES